MAAHGGGMRGDGDAHAAVISQEQGRVDCVVIGGGIMGACTAYHLAKRSVLHHKRGVGVVLLEQFDWLHRRGSSHGSSRIIRSTYKQRHYTLMMRSAYASWSQAEREAGTRLVTRTGGLDFARRASHGKSALDDLVRACEEFGVEHAVLTPTEVAERWPRLTLPDDYVAVYNKDAGMIDATKSVATFLRLAEKHGATLRDGVEVAGIEKGEDGAGLFIHIKGGGSIQADRCVVTAGAWCQQLLRSVAGMEVPTQPLHTTVGYWQCDDPEDFSADRFPLFINYSDESIGVYGLPIREYPGLLKVSSHRGQPCDPATRTLQPDSKELQEFVAPFIRQFLKGVSDTPAVAEACMYTNTPDEDFILDYVPGWDNTLVIGGGFSGHGFKFGPLVGEILADLAMGRTCSTDLTPFRITRLVASAV